jgi:hypothetical protein
VHGVLKCPHRTREFVIDETLKYPSNGNKIDSYCVGVKELVRGDGRLTKRTREELFTSLGSLQDVQLI